jgi:putative ABC transport system permease protein
VVVALTFGLGIGINSAIFSVVNASLLRPLPFPHSERLVALGETNPGWSSTLASSLTYLEWRTRSWTFDELATAVWWDTILENASAPIRVTQSRVTENYFRVLGVAPAMGRTFTPEECAAAAKVVVLSHRLWKQLGADLALLGGTLRLGGEPHVVLGVMPEIKYSGPFIGLGDFWTPQRTDERAIRERRLGWRGFRVIGRLRAGLSVETAHAELTAIHAQLQAEYPSQYTDFGVMAQPLDRFISGTSARTIVFAWIAAGMVFLVACVNVCHLLLARFHAQIRQVALRIALGASRGRVVTSCLIESLLLAGIGVAAGLGIAHLSLSLIGDLYREAIPRFAEIEVGWRVLVAASLLGIVAGIACGLIPAWRIASVDPGEIIKEGVRGSQDGPHRSRVRQRLVAMEAAMSVLLLILFGLTHQSFRRLLSADKGIQAQHVLTFDVTLPSGAYSAAERRTQFYRELLARLEEIPGVISASANRYFPLRDRQVSESIQAEGEAVVPGSEHIVQYGGVATRYFQTLGTPILEGRDFDAHEVWEGRPVAIINRSLAQRLFPQRSAMGQRIRQGLDKPWLRIVGVVEDVRQRGLDQESYPQVFFPYGEAKHSIMTVAVRTRSEPELFIPAIRAQIRALDAGLPIYNLATLDEARRLSQKTRDSVRSLLGGLAATALALVMVGLYGVLADLVSQRKMEIGIRRALGGRALDILLMVVGDVWRTAAIGALVGIGVSLAAARAMTSLLFGFGFEDVLLYLLAPLFLFVLATVAAVVPAVRALRVDPAIALRTE